MSLANAKLRKLRPQQYRLKWPLTADQVEGIDEMLQTLFKATRELQQGVTTASTQSTQAVALATGLIGDVNGDGNENAGLLSVPGPTGPQGLIGSSAPSMMLPIETADEPMIWTPPPPDLSNFVTLNGTNAFTGSNSFANSLVDLLVGQLRFPAAQNPSAGANVLDDYEEGTWTPVIGGSGGTSGQAYTTQSGFYIKIGKLVVATFFVTLSTKGTITALTQLQGLPFTVDNVANNNSISTIVWLNTATAFVTMLALGVINTTAASIFAATAAATSLSNITTTDIANNTSFIGTICYQASA